MALGVGLQAVRGEDVVHLVLVEQAVDQPLLEGILGQHYLQIVGHAVELLGRDAARVGDGPHERSPDGVDQLLHLQPVGVRHAVEDVGLDGALVLADRRTEDLGVEVQLVEQPLVEGEVEGQTRPVHSPFGVEVYAVCHRGKIVGPLVVDLVVGDDELAALPEVGNRAAQLLHEGRTGDAARAVEAQVDAADAAVGGRGLDGAHRLEDGQRVTRGHRREVKLGQRIRCGRVGDGLVEVDFENRAVGNRDRLLEGARQTGHAHQQHHADVADEEASDHEGQHPRQKSLEKIHCAYGFYCLLFSSMFLKVRKRA